MIPPADDEEARVSGSAFTYTGCDNLEVMTDAVNYNRFLTDSVLRHVPGPTARVLDFGAGSGTYADMLVERGVRPDVLEPDGTLHRMLRDKGHRVVELGADGVGDYDVIYSLNVFEHIKNDQEAADDLGGLLRPGGRIVIYVPALEMLFTSMDTKVEHYRRYRRKQLERVLTNAGLEIVESRYCDPVGFFATLFYKWFGSDSGAISPRALKLYDRTAFPLSRLLQRVLGRAFGKNVLVVATRHESSQPVFTTR
jgi:SAM-dependent methyltransferase